MDRQKVSKATLERFGGEVTRIAETLGLDNENFLKCLLIVAAWVFVHDNPEQSDEAIISKLSDRKLLGLSISVARGVEGDSHSAMDTPSWETIH